MAFQSIPKVESPDTYLDIAFRRGRERAGLIKQKKPNKRATSGEERFKEMESFKAMNKSLVESLSRIVDSFPRYDELTPFYKELLECSVDLGGFRKALGAVNWAKNKIMGFHDRNARRIAGTYDYNVKMSQKKMLYGRIASVLKQISKELAYLEDCRKIIKRFPVIKEGVKTIAIFGFPNVGKTTLLAKLTKSRPEIAAYPFTTKTINLGYITIGIKKLQLLDTPGSLNRFEKMNSIERQAYLALKHVADVIVYVFDLTEPYPLDMQIKLYKSIKDFRKPVLVYFSKADILDMKLIEEFSEKIEGFSDVEQLKEAILKV